MRPKFLFVLLLLALLVLGGVFFLKQHLGNGSTSAATIPASSAPVDSNAMADVVPPPAPMPVPMVPAATNVLTPEQRQAAIDAETDRLSDWSMNDDSASLSNILAELNSPEQEVREAAIEATKQFGSTNAIPALKAAANNTDDPREKIDLLEAADFLSLPSISTVGPANPKTPEQIQALEQQIAEKRARNKEAQLQKRSASQNLQPAPDTVTPPPADPKSSDTPGN